MISAMEPPERFNEHTGHSDCAGYGWFTTWGYRGPGKQGEAVQPCRVCNPNEVTHCLACGEVCGGSGCPCPT